MNSGKVNKSRKLFSSFVAAIAMVLIFSGSLFAASDWPTKSVNVLMHTKPGGTSDIFIRTLAQSLEPEIGQTLNIINAPGGGGATQMSRIAAATPDGYTIGINTLSHFTNMLTNLKGTFTPDDFSWIATVQEDPIIFFVKADSDIKSLDDLIKKAKENPGGVNIGGFGSIGSMQNIGSSMFENAAGIKLNWVAFNATPDIITSLLGDHIEVGITNGGPLKPFIESGRVRGIGVLGPSRLDKPLENILTFGEQGVDVDTSWVQVRGVYGPKGIPMEVQQKIADAFHKAMKAESYQKYRESTGVTDSWLGPKEYSAFVSKIMATAEKQLIAAGVVK
jgi:tripartite-type tricarboxylate transporter receptor subunit TctC